MCRLSLRLIAILQEGVESFRGSVCLPQVGVGALLVIMIVLLMSKWGRSRGRLWGSDFEGAPFDFEFDRDAAKGVTQFQEMHICLDFELDVKNGAVILMTLVLLMSRWRIRRGRLWGSDLEDVPFDFDNDRDTAGMEERGLKDLRGTAGCVKCGVWRRVLGDDRLVDVQMEKKTWPLVGE